MPHCPLFFSLIRFVESFDCHCPPYSILALSPLTPFSPRRINFSPEDFYPARPWVFVIHELRPEHPTWRPFALPSHVTNTKVITFPAGSSETLPSPTLRDSREDGLSPA